MKQFLFLLLCVPFLSFAETEVTNTPEYLRATLSSEDSDFLYKSLQVEVEDHEKRIATQDSIAELVCTEGKACVLTLLKVPVREQSTIFAESNGYFLAQTDTFHEGERIFNALGLYRMRGKTSVAKMFYSDDYRAFISCVYHGKNDSYFCQFGIR